MDNIAAFASNPFMPIYIEQVADEWRDSDFWRLSRDTFPLLTACALRASDPRTSHHTSDCLRLAVCSYEPNYKALTDSIQSQPSHWLVTWLQQFCLLMAFWKVMVHNMEHTTPVVPKLGGAPPRGGAQWNYRGGAASSPTQAHTHIHTHAGKTI